MYNFQDINVGHDFIETYEILLQDRITDLDFTGKKKNIAYVFYEKDYGTFRYRCYNMCQIINQSEKFRASFFIVKENELPSLIKIIDHIDVIVFSRVPWDYEVDDLIQVAVRKNIKLVYDVDDLIFDITKAPKLVNNLHIDSSGLDFWFGYIARRNYLANICSFHITTNNFLRDKMNNSFPGKRTYVIPNFLNEEQIKISKKLYNLKKSKNSTHSISDTFLIGYFSGTASHNHDFAIISKDLESILEKFDHVKLRIVGYLSLPEELQKFENQGRIERYSLVNYWVLQQLIAECDLNLIPLVENEFTNCKSELKFFESAIVGTPSIASPTYIYKECIRDGDTGFIAKPGEWKDKIENLILDKNFYQFVSKGAFDVSLHNYYGDIINRKVFSVINNIIK